MEVKSKRHQGAPQIARLSVCALGDMQQSEFADAKAWLHSHAKLLAAESVADAEELARLRALQGESLDLLLLACARRGQFNSADVQRLRSASPLARIVALAGSWCDGPWRRECDWLPGVAIVTWHRWPAWSEVNGQQLAFRRAPSWALPDSTTADELAEFWSGQPLKQDRGLIAIDSPHAESAEVLADVVRAAGFSAVWQSPSSGGFIDGVRAVVCEADDAHPATVERVAQLSRQFAPSPVLALLNFPRAEDIERIMAVGAAAVVGKPFTLHEILAQLEDALRGEAKSRSVAA